MRAVGITGKRRTTRVVSVSWEPDVLEALRETAERRGVSVSRVVNETMRRALKVRASRPVAA